MAALLRGLGCVLAVAVLLVAMVAVPTPAFACSCAQAATDQGSWQRAAVVFTGELLADDTHVLGGTRTVTYRVHRVYKGSAFAEQPVVTQASSASCGLEEGARADEYLVFARQTSSSRLTAALCEGTRIGSAPAAFGPGVAPRPGSGRTTSIGWFAAGAGLVLASAALMLVWRQRRGAKA